MIRSVAKTILCWWSVEEMVQHDVVLVVAKDVRGLSGKGMQQQAPTSNKFNGQQESKGAFLTDIKTRRGSSDVPNTKKRLVGSTIPKYVTELFIPPVLHDGSKEENFEIALRQFEQQILPKGYPMTEVWGYGDPQKPASFHHPAASVEVTRNKKTYVTWRNELVSDPVACRMQKYGGEHHGAMEDSSCDFLSHVLQDIAGTPLVDQSLHWANPNKICRDGMNRTDCEGLLGTPYAGPVPIVTHVHGAHVEPRSDGYPESWFLAAASNIPKGYATEGRRFQSRYLPSAKVPDDGNKYLRNALAGDVFFKPATDAARGHGYTVFRYTNDQDSTALWYHDHTLGVTRLNVYAAGAGFWFIREAGGGETLLGPKDAKDKLQSLPGPPPKAGQDPNNDLKVRATIREIPLLIQDKSFYTNGDLFYKASRAADDFPECDDGTKVKTGLNNIPYYPKSDIPPQWINGQYFDTFVVNGNTWPKFTVAPDRYRLRFVNACEFRTINLVFRVGGTNGKDLPFFVIGSDQGMLPNVVKIRSGFATVIQPGEPVSTETPLPTPEFGLLMAPGERFDVIVDFIRLKSGTEVYLTNTGPSDPFLGGTTGDLGQSSFWTPTYLENNTMPDVMKFVVQAVKKQPPKTTSSTTPYDLKISNPFPDPQLPAVQKTRDLSLNGVVSSVCIKKNDLATCNITDIPRDCSHDLPPFFHSYGLVKFLLGTNGSKFPFSAAQRWMDPITQNPAFGSTEVWELWNGVPDIHPIHLHQVDFRVLGRWNQTTGKFSRNPYPWELGKKDTVIATPFEVTKVKMTFDIGGLYVWHCHFLGHEDNEMMLPLCVGTPGVDCPADLF